MPLHRAQQKVTNHLKHTHSGLAETVFGILAKPFLPHHFLHDRQMLSELDIFWLNNKSIKFNCFCFHDHAEEQVVKGDGNFGKSFSSDYAQRWRIKVSSCSGFTHLVFWTSLKLSVLSLLMGGIFNKI